MANYIHLPPGSPEVPRLNVTVLEETGYREGAMVLLKDLRPQWRPEDVTTQVSIYLPKAWATRLHNGVLVCKGLHAGNNSPT